ncbi:hypothetical protein BpHYR1_035758 [Brachionus plicatilis]|uniref:Uncharacterized protein n=1 Tax=Brachionus plicatilis TaxID=10195 RepID=A0A3M7PLX4_BRAPC|nr:hypothetical protein BpHYR1_035758 [Brachionus plicatilis]
MTCQNEQSRDELNNQTRPFGFGLNQFDLRGNQSPDLHLTCDLWILYNFIIKFELILVEPME